MPIASNCRSRDGCDSRAAAKWLKEADRTWSELIGARVIEDGIIKSCYCRYLKNGNPITKWVLESWTSDYNECESLEDDNDISLQKECMLRDVIKPLIKVKPSDGVVLVESAANYPGTDLNMQREMLNTSHMQMRNNGELKDALKALYDGDVNPYFKLDIK